MSYKDRDDLTKIIREIDALLDDRRSLLNLNQRAEVFKAKDILKALLK